MSRFVVIKSEGTTSIDIPFPVDPSKVKRVEFPTHDGLADGARRVLEASDNVLGFEKLSGAALYERLDDIRRAGLLNILAKNAVHTGQFVEAPGVLHHPPERFEHAGSFKTTDHFANLQLTFFARGDQWMADIDIDDANGVEHLFQVLRNQISGRPTHPYDIHELLVSYQKLDPGYTLIV